ADLWIDRGGAVFHVAGLSGALQRLLVQPGDVLAIDGQHLMKSGAVDHRIAADAGVAVLLDEPVQHLLRHGPFYEFPRRPLLLRAGRDAEAMAGDPREGALRAGRDQPVAHRALDRTLGVLAERQL